MRDLMMLAAMLAFVPLSLINAFVAYLLWGWTAVLSPVFYLYGFMRPLRFNLLFAAITVLALVFGRLSERGKLSFTRTQALFILFALHASASALLAIPNNPFNLQYYEGLMKVMAFCLLMPLFATSRLRIHALLVMLVLGLGFHGLLEGLKFIASGGGHRVTGIQTTMMGDNNHFAVGMLLAVPIAYYLSQFSARRLVRFGFICVALLTVAAILGTHSRGGFLGLAIVGVGIAWGAPKRWLGLSMVALGAVTILLLAPESWFERIETIGSAKEDSSFMGRVAAWQISSAIALANPIFGGGFHALQAQATWEFFRGAGGLFSFITPGDIPLIAKAAHSIYFEVLGDLGFIGLLLFLALLGNALWTRFEIRRLSRNDAQLGWAKSLADLLAVSIAAYMVSGAGVSLAYFEPIYVLIALMEALKQLVLRDHRATVPVGHHPVQSAQAA